MIFRKPPSKMVCWRNQSSQGRTLCKLFYSFDLAWRVVCVWPLGVWKQVQKKKLFKEVDSHWRPSFQWIIFPCSIDFYDSMTSILIVRAFFLPLLFLSMCLLLNFHKPVLILEYPIEALSSLWLVKQRWSLWLLNDKYVRDISVVAEFREGVFNLYWRSLENLKD